MRACTLLLVLSVFAFPAFSQLEELSPHNEQFYSEGLVQLRYSQVMERLPFDDETARQHAERYAMQSHSLNQHLANEERNLIAAETREAMVEHFTTHDVQHNEVEFTFAEGFYRYRYYDEVDGMVYELVEENGICKVWNNVGIKSGMPLRTDEYAIDKDSSNRYASPMLLWNSFFRNKPADVSIQVSSLEAGATELRYTNQYQEEFVLTYKEIEGHVVPVRKERNSPEKRKVTTYSDYVERGTLFIPSLIVVEGFPAMKTLDVVSTIGQTKTTYALQ